MTTICEKTLEYSRLPSVLVDLINKYAQLEYKVTYYHGGTKKRKEWYELFGVKEGPYKSYWDNGQLWVDTTYHGGQPEGPYKRYWGNGQLYEDITYQNGVEISRRI
jgi:antitoxin component YwqK of YwqJK toxin-antitoxin module